MSCHMSYNMRHASCVMLHASCAMRHASCAMRHATCDMRHAPCSWLITGEDFTHEIRWSYNWWEGGGGVYSAFCGIRSSCVPCVPVCIGRGSICEKDFGLDVKKKWLYGHNVFVYCPFFSLGPFFYKTIF